MEKAPVYVTGVLGAGKTRTVLELLSAHWGVHFSAGMYLARSPRHIIVDQSFSVGMYGKEDKKRTNNQYHCGEPAPISAALLLVERGIPQSHSNRTSP